jgi:hypothetical protein
MRFWETFRRSRIYTNEELEARRVRGEYYRPGSLAEQDKEDYIAWLEQQLESRLTAAGLMVMNGDSANQEDQS